MPTLNKVTLMGHLGKDPEIRIIGDGLKVASFSLATSESWIDKASGERKDKTEWHRVSVMNPRLAEVVERYLRKGSAVFLEGKIQTRKWTTQNGEEKSIVEILISQFKGELIMLSKKEGASQDYGQESQDGSYQKTLDDEIPF